MKPHVRSLTCVALLAAQLLTGCSTWQVVHVTPRALVDSAHVSTMQVTETSGATYIIDSPRLVGDSLTGASFRVDVVDLRTMQSRERKVAARHVPLAAIDRVAIMKSDATVVIVVIVGVVVLVAAIGGAATYSDHH